MKGVYAICPACRKKATTTTYYNLQFSAPQTLNAGRVVFATLKKKTTRKNNGSPLFYAGKFSFLSSCFKSA